MYRQGAAKNPNKNRTKIVKSLKYFLIGEADYGQGLLWDFGGKILDFGFWILDFGSRLSPGQALDF
jgi:hypothetical protein